MLPPTVSKVLAAGPPASVVLYTLAPDKLLGWVRRPDDDAKAYLAKPYRDLPAQLRLTGREPADPAAVKALGAGIIVDFGTVDGRYAGIAERTQAATGIAYVLIDGALARTAAAYRQLGQVVRAGPRAETLAGKSQAMLDEVSAKVAGLSPRKLLVVRGPDGDEVYGAGAFTEEIIKPAGGANVAESWGHGIVKQHHAGQGARGRSGDRDRDRRLLPGNGRPEPGLEASAGDRCRPALHGAAPAVRLAR